VTPPPEDDDFKRTRFIGAGWTPEAAPGPDVAHYLVAVAGAEPGRRVEIGAEPITIGRDTRQTLVFAADNEVSRLHARVSMVNGEVVAEDLGSTNGTFVDAQKITAPVTLREGGVLQVGHQILKYERRSRSDVERTRELDRDLLKARNYVYSLLPAPLDAGTVRTDWCFVPSAHLGGDAFGYYWLDPGTFVFYLIDVSGHGIGAAMHSVTVLNVLRQRALPQVDFENPGQVLSTLNTRFQMDAHNGMYFTMWYGVYRTSDRTLVYASAGHHPAYVVEPGRRTAHPLGTPALMIGAMPDREYQVQQATIPPASALYLFSDGVFEIVTKDQQRWALSDFLPLLVEPPRPGTPETERLFHAVMQAAAPGPLEDDFSLMVVTFP
jgi:serine phosphatase RsbU (regulator of sigma subunit)